MSALLVSLHLFPGVGEREAAPPPLSMRLDVLGLARALGAVAPAAGSIDDDAEGGRSNADEDAAFASAWLQSGAVLALHPSR